MIKRTDKQQLKAQETTINVLKKKVYDLYNSQNKTQIHNALESARKRAEEAREKRDILEQQKRVLEVAVEQRTRDLSEKTHELDKVLNSLYQGILMIQPDGTIHQNYSAYLESILNQSDIAGKLFKDVVLQHALIQEGPQTQMLNAIDGVFGDSELTFQMNEALLLKEFDITIGDTVKSLFLDWIPIMDDDFTVTKLLVSIRDVTELKALKAQTKNREIELERIGAILSVPIKRFDSFIKRSLQFVDQNREIISEGTLYDEDAVPTLFRNMHTLKGNSRVMGFNDIADKAHVVEDAYQTIRESSSNFINEDLQSYLLDDIDQLESVILSYKNVYESKIKKASSGSAVDVHHPSYQKAKNAFKTFSDALKDSPHQESLRTMESLFLTLESTPFDDVVDVAQKSLPRIAQRLEKETPKLEFNGDSLFIANQNIDPLQDCLMHLLRNAIDHGIESKDERKQAGKSELGIISLSAEIQADQNLATIYISDDGRGLNMERIREISEQRGLLHQDKVPDDIVAQNIFVSGFTTSEVVTDISGRGVGMDAVKLFVESLGGTISIELDAQYSGQKLRPFTLKLTMPNVSTLTFD